MSSIVRAATRAAVTITVGVLVAVGVGTGAILHLSAVAAYDETLLAALVGGPSADDIDGASPDYRVVDPGAVPGLPEEWVARARFDERVVLGNLGDRRVVLGAVDAAEDDEQPHEHDVFAAVGPRVTLTDSAGPFAVAWLGMTVVGAALAAALQRWQVGRIVAPLGRAVTEAASVAREGPRARLTEEGPDEVRSLLVAVNGLLAQLDASFSAQTRFTAEAAHELRTPITALVGEVEVTLRKPRSAEELRDTLVRVGASSRRLAELVDGLLLLARVDSGLAEDVREDRTLSALVRAALAQEAEDLRAAGVTVDLRLDDEVVVRVHPPLLVAAVATLVRNVARYAPGSPVEVGVEVADGVVSVCIDDGGPGIPVAERGGAFDRFARGASARRAAPDGLGLGLPLARAVAQAHGGACTIETGHRRGCRIRLSLPVRAPSGS